ncbi:MAG: hypothetical protein ACI8V4_002737 [Ilumatobacter sp.]|jgi:uncharacterized protein (DUF1800 family)
MVAGMDVVADPKSPAVLDRRHTLFGVAATLFAAAGCSSATSEATTAPAAGSGTTTSPTPSDALPPAAEDNETSTAQTNALPAPADIELHMLRRLSYGPAAEDVDRIRLLGAGDWLSEQLSPESLNTAELEARLSDTFPELDQTAPELIADYRADGNGPQLFSVLTAAQFARHTTSPAQLFERLVEFWGDHFNAPQITPPATIARIVMDREVVRPNALGRFDDLLVAVAQSPAMLRYLDNGSSSVGAINENYARELLELHTVGVDGGYAEDDIVEVARLLTGWGFTRELEFRFTPTRHDNGPVSMLGWERPASGDVFEHGIDFLRHLALLPATARLVCHKLAVRFVADDPDDALVEAMAAAWIDNNSEIELVVRTMVEHPSFDVAPPKFNRPWDYYVQTLRSVGNDLDITNQRSVRDAIGAAQDLGQVPFRWPSPDGYPDRESFWLDAGALLTRWDLALDLTNPDNKAIDTDVGVRIQAVRGLTAAEMYDGLSHRFRFEPIDNPTLIALNELTGWAPDHRPDNEELDEFAPHIIFLLITSPSALYR